MCSGYFIPLDYETSCLPSRYFALQESTKVKSCHLVGSINALSKFHFTFAIKISYFLYFKWIKYIGCTFLVYRQNTMSPMSFTGYSPCVPACLGIMISLKSHDHIPCPSWSITYQLIHIWMHIIENVLYFFYFLNVNCFLNTLFMCC